MEKRDKLLDLERISLADADLFLYPEYLGKQELFSNAKTYEKLGGTRGCEVKYSDKTYNMFVAKPERKEDDHYRKKFQNNGWVQMEKEISIARALSSLANKEFLDTNVIFEKPYGMLVNEEGKFGLFEKYNSAQDNLKLNEFDDIKKRIKTLDKKGLPAMIKFNGKKFPTQMLFDSLKDLYSPESFAKIVLNANGINGIDYKAHNYLENSKPTGLVADFEIVKFFDKSSLAEVVCSEGNYLTERISEDDDFTLKEVLESSKTLEGVVGQKNPLFSFKSSKDLGKLKNRREEAYKSILEYTGMQNLQDENIKPGPAFELIDYIKNAKPSELISQ